MTIFLLDQWLYKNALLLTSAHSRSCARAARPRAPPVEILQRRSPASAAVGGRLKRREIQLFDQLAIRLARAARPSRRGRCASATASEIVLPLTRFSACGRLRSAAPLALAGRFARRPAEQIEKAFLADVRIDELLGLGIRRHFGKHGPHAGRQRERIHQLLGASAGAAWRARSCPRPSRSIRWSRCSAW